MSARQRPAFGCGTPCARSTRRQPGAWALIVGLLAAGACGDAESGRSPGTSRADAAVPGAVAVRQLPTGYDRMTSALSSMATASPLVAHDAAAWGAHWRRLGIPGRPPAVAFSREVGVLYGFARVSANGFRATLDSARLRADDTLRLYVDLDHESASYDTTSYSLVAAAVARPRRPGAPAAYAVVVTERRALARFRDELRGLPSSQQRR